MNKENLNLILAEDLKRISESDIPYEKLSNSTILITGATGLIGSMLVKTLLYLNTERRLNITVLALVRSTEKANSIFADFLPDRALKYVVNDLVYDDLIIENRIDFIIHTASVTTSKIMVESPVETIFTAFHGTEKTLELAKKMKVRSYIYISSMEMYGSFRQSSGPTTEEKLGYIDPLNIRSNYPESKRMCENLCAAYHSEYGVPITIARLSQTFGAGILPTENRVFVQFARSVIEGKDIVLHTKGLSEGNYSYLAETVEAILLLLLNGCNGEAYNVANEICHTTIADMANMVADKISNGRIKVVYDIPQGNVFGYAADTHMQLSSEKIRKLGWNPKIDLEESYTRMIKYMITCKEFETLLSYVPTN